MNNRRRLLYLIPALLLTALGTAWGWQQVSFWRTHISTDNAYVGADMALVTPRVAGTVIWVGISENWQVDTSDIIVRLDPADFDVKLREAEAALTLAHEQLEERRAAVRAAAARVRLAQADLKQAKIDHDRARQLVQTGAAAIERLDRTTTGLLVAQARLASAARQEDRAKAALGISLDTPDSEASIVRRAQAQRDAAALARSYTEIRAPISGLVAKKSVEVGQRVQPGQPLMAVVPLSEVYVDANFKETKLESVRVGQPVTVKLDLYPDVTYEGQVDSIGAGTGSAFAIFPPENATGNWVKVVQRIPVRISLKRPFPRNHPPRLGLSAVVSIDISKQGEDLLCALSQQGSCESQGN